jgi:hypothetical protein
MARQVSDTILAVLYIKLRVPKLFFDLAGPASDPFCELAFPLRGIEVN